MSQKLSVNYFKWVKHISKFDEIFITSYKEERDKGYFLEVDVQYPVKLHDLHHFYLKERRLKKSKSLWLIFMIRLNMLYT